MAVAQLVEHLGADPEQLLTGYAGLDLRGIAVVDVVPVYPLLGEEAVVLVDDRPEGLEVALCRVGKLVDLVARGEEREQ